MSDPLPHARALRAEAMRLLNGILKLPEGVSSSAAERFVDCIIGAAVLEITSIYHQAAEEARNTKLP